jgi:hypothetical protein
VVQDPSGIGLDVIQAPKPVPRMMRYELTNFEWAAIRPFLPNKRAAFPSFLICALNGILNPRWGHRASPRLASNRSNSVAKSRSTSATRMLITR